MGFRSFFSSIVSVIGHAIRLAKDSGLTDEVVHIAVQWGKIAAQQFTTNDERREFVVKVLLARGVPERVARIAVELAVQIIKDQE